MTNIAKVLMVRWIACIALGAACVVAACSSDAKLHLVSIACDGDKNSDGFLNRAEDQNAATTDKFEMTCTVTFREDAGGREVRIVSSQPQAGNVVGRANASGRTARSACRGAGRSSR